MFFRFYPSDITQYLFFSVWLISPSIIPSKSIYVVANGKISFFFMAGVVFYCMYMPHFLFLSFVDGHLVCFRILAVNKAVINIEEHISFQISDFVFLRYMPRSGTVGSYGSSVEKAMAPNSSTLAWKIPWTEESGRLQSMGLRRVRHDWATSLSLSCIGEGNGYPLQCSCLEKPMDRGPWQAAGHGVAKRQTWLKWPSTHAW